jgi:hypothetical protein
VLKIFSPVRKAVPPGHWTERPQLGITEHKEEQTGDKETDRPHIATVRPMMPKCAVYQNEDTCENDKNSGEMMIELTFALVSEELGLSDDFRSGIKRLYRHGHFVVGMPFMHGVILALRACERGRQESSECVQKSKHVGDAFYRELG